MEGKDLLREELRMENNLYRVVVDQVPKSVVTTRNKKKRGLMDTVVTMTLL